MNIETRIIRKALRNLKAAGMPVVKVHDGEAFERVATEAEAIEVIQSVDFARAYTASGSWVQFVNGNEEDVIADFSTDIEQFMPGF